MVDDVEHGKESSSPCGTREEAGILIPDNTDEEMVVITPCKHHRTTSLGSPSNVKNEDGFPCTEGPENACDPLHLSPALEKEADHRDATTSASASYTSVKSIDDTTTPHGAHDDDRHGNDVCSRSKVISMDAALEEEENVCSICLDEFTDEDPSAETRCGHGYHLQCIMQWAQRSRECPLCFEELGLTDDDLHSLLPFGEYISPQQREVESSIISNMQLERFLIQLAAVERREHRRAQRMRMARESSDNQGEDRGHVVLTTGSCTPPREDSLIRSASLSLKNVKDKFASLFFSKPHSESNAPSHGE